jgi:hypothetical protein
MNPVSCCLIVRDDPHLAKTIDSVRPFVSEVCLFTDTPDDLIAEQQRALVDRFERAFDLNGASGKLSDWSAARNRVQALATQPWVLTLDSDDILEHGERLADVIAQYDGPEPVRICFPYDYQFDPMTGRCTRRQPRVRLVNRPECFEWRRRAHEGLFAKEGVEVRNVYDLRVSVRHTKRDWSVAAERATAIIQGDAGPEGESITDPRDRFDYGMNLAQNGREGDAVRELTRYVEESGRNDEKAQACLRIAELVGHMGDLATPIAWCDRAAELSPDAFEPYYKRAQLWLVLAMTHGGDQDYARNAVADCKRAVATPLDSLVPYSPQDREVGVYEVWHEAAKVLGDADEQEEALWAGTKSGDPGMWLRRAEHYGIRHGVIGSTPREVIFLCGQCRPWNPVSVEQTGHGGSELAVVAMAKGLADKGHRVRVYVSCGREGLYDGVEYLEPWRLNEEHEEVDLLVAWRNAAFLDAVPAKTKWIWVHDTTVANPTPYRISMADRILALSEWHRQHLVESKFPAERVHVTRNGIGELWFEPSTARRDPHKCIYASSPDRGLEALIAMWPRIRQRVPDATLEVYYGDDGLLSKYPRRAWQIRWDLEDLAGCGVTNHGRVSQRELAEAMRGAGCLLYPTRFDDTYCIVVDNANAAGLRVITSRRAALPERATSNTVLLDGDPDDALYRETFVAMAVHAMTAPDLGDREASANEARQRCRWAPVVDQWDEWLRADLAAEVAA